MNYALVLVYVYALGILTGFAVVAAIRAHKLAKHLRKVAAELEALPDD